MSAPDWLTARPIAHRGLHDRAAGIPENTIAAAEAAIAGGYAIECDVQPSLEGEAMVFHDADLARLTGSDGPIAGRSLPELSMLRVLGSAEHISSLPDFLGAIAGRTPLVVEIKTRFDGDLRLTRRVAEVALAYPGPIALKSFDPEIVATLAELAPGLPRGIVAESHHEDASYARLDQAERFALGNLLHLGQSRPDFLSWSVNDLPSGPPHLCRLLGRMSVMTWTVRTDEQRRIAAAHADQMVFEGFRP